MIEEHAAGDVPCGLYVTTEPVDELVEEGALVYFHNHGDPAPALYKVSGWRNNKAIFSKQAHPLPFIGYERSLKPLLPEGFYSVKEEFSCCEKSCRVFPEGTLVQLGYKGDGTPIIFVPEWSYDGLSLPEKGTRIGEKSLSSLSPLKVVRAFGRRKRPRKRSSELTILGSGYLH